MKPKKTQLFFIALLPPVEVQEVANGIKEQFAQFYQSSAAQKSPPHITLQPPFRWKVIELPLLQENLQKFAMSQSAVPIILDGFGAFKSRVIYINVLQTPELMSLQTELITMLKLSLNIQDKLAKNNPFSPHITVAFRDLTKENFQRAWPEFQWQQLHFEFTVPQLTLLNHNGKFWEVIQEFNFQVIG
ncbi:MAG: 2'-5' RNA ligase family protein [Gomphosphaeria aponina SAG 52.96 = DSM 107014]|uniref:2'-5' RNA ligase family protein n=1 Tax=Gomphosphaeria aponina SAG 52.96 = DSM 107014 TaxID=1521640 RepID=A0A941GP87_9CHRO|nr:2'-5' RNA ligase family protein [Gomphosphaeria aponina SAG 52.96 = DSM 107014]